MSVKVKICTPYYMEISEETKRSVSSLNGKIDYTWIVSEATYIGRGRDTTVLGRDNSLTKPKLEESFSHYLMLDSDIGFTYEQLKQLLDRDLPIVSGLYKSRGKQGKAVAGWFTIVEGNLGEYIPVDANGLKEVDWCGAGFLLIKKEVFEKLEYPWFRHNLISFTDSKNNKHSLSIGEDISFCINTKKIGYNTFVDCDCKVKHITNKAQAYHLNGGNPMAEQNKVDFKSFVMYQSGVLDTIKSSIDKLVTQYNDVINNLYQENIKLQKEIANEKLIKEEKVNQCQ